MGRGTATACRQIDHLRGDLDRVFMGGCHANRLMSLKVLKCRKRDKWSRLRNGPQGQELPCPLLIRLHATNPQGFLGATQCGEADAFLLRLVTEPGAGHRDPGSEAVFQPAHGLEEGVRVWPSTTAGEHLRTQARPTTPFKLAVLLREQQGPPKRTNVAFTLRQQGFAGVCGMLFDEEAGAGRADEIDGP